MVCPAVVSDLFVLNIFHGLLFLMCSLIRAFISIVSVSGNGLMRIYGIWCIVGPFVISAKKTKDAVTGDVCVPGLFISLKCLLIGHRRVRCPRDPAQLFNWQNFHCQRFDRIRSIIIVSASTTCAHNNKLNHQLVTSIKNHIFISSPPLIMLSKRGRNAKTTVGCKI